MTISSGHWFPGCPTQGVGFLVGVYCTRSVLGALVSRQVRPKAVCLGREEVARSRLGTGTLAGLPAQGGWPRHPALRAPGLWLV